MVPSNLSCMSRRWTSGQRYQVSLFMSKARECWLVKEIDMKEAAEPNKKKNPVKKETPKAKKVVKKPSAKKV